MNIRPSGNTPYGLDHVTDQQIGQTFPIVRKVYNHLDEINYVASVYASGRSRDVVLRVNNTARTVEWQYKGDAAWQTLFTFSALLGKDVSNIVADQQELALALQELQARMLDDIAVIEEALVAVNDDKLESLNYRNQAANSATIANNAANSANQSKIDVNTARAEVNATANTVEAIASQINSRADTIDTGLQTALDLQAQATVSTNAASASAQAAGLAKMAAEAASASVAGVVAATAAKAAEAAASALAAANSEQAATLDASSAAAAAALATDAQNAAALSEQVAAQAVADSAASLAAAENAITIANTQAGIAESHAEAALNYRDSISTALDTASGLLDQTTLQANAAQTAAQQSQTAKTDAVAAANAAQTAQQNAETVSANVADTVSDVNSKYVEITQHAANINQQETAVNAAALTAENAVASAADSASSAAASAAVATEKEAQTTVLHGQVVQARADIQQAVLDAAAVNSAKIEVTLAKTAVENIANTVNADKLLIEGYKTTAESSASYANAQAIAAGNHLDQVNQAAAVVAAALPQLAGLPALVQSATDASDTAINQSNKAKAWADAPINTEVEPGKYSAKHWAEKATAAANNGLVYVGNIDLSAGVFPQVAKIGDFYTVSVAGSIAGVDYRVNDNIIYNGGGWDHVNNSGSVSSVAGKLPDASGNIAITASDIGLSNVNNTADVDKPVSTAVAAALNNKVDAVAGKGLSDNNYTNTAVTKLAGIAENATANQSDAYLLNRENHTNTQPISTIEGLDTALATLADNKVDKVTGKQLSTEDYTTAEKDKLSGIEAGANNYTHPANHPASVITQDADNRFVSDAEKASWNAKATAAAVADVRAYAETKENIGVAQALVTGLENSLNPAKVGLGNVANLAPADLPVSTAQSAAINSAVSTGVAGKVDKVTGKGLSTEDYSTEDKTKLASIAAGATVNATDAQLRDRTTHTGVQGIETITGLQTTLDSKAAASSLGSAAAANVPASGNAAAGEVVLGSDTRLTNARVPAGNAGGVLAGTYPNPVFATDMATQAELDTVAGSKVDKVTGKQLSTEDYTSAEKSKLANIANNANNYTHPANHPASIITQDANNRFVTDTEKATWNGKLTDAPSDGKTRARKDGAWVETLAAANPVITGTIVEDVFTITDGSSVDINPANGSIQTWTLGASRSPTAASFGAGQSVILMVTAGANSLTWPTVKWSKVGGSGAAPSLTSSGATCVILWKVGSTLYGSLLGTV